MAGTYKAGTVTVTNGSAAIVGAGTAWLANLSAGDVFRLVDEDVAYVVAGVTDDTHLSLSAPYAGTGGGGKSYEVTRDFTPLGLPLVQRGDMSVFAVLTRAFVLIDAFLRTVGASLAIVAGDLIYGSGPKTLARLAKGDEQAALKIVNGLPAWRPSREVLTANRTYYVSTTGSDANDGLTAGAPFLTIAKAFSTVASRLDTASYTVTIQLADGTYTAPVVVPQWLGGGKIVVNGNAATPSSVVVHSTSGLGTFNLSVPGYLQIQNLKISAAGASSSCLYADGAAAKIEIGAGLEFGAAGTAHIYSSNGADIWVPNSYKISGGATFHFAAIGGKVRFASGITVTLTGTPAFSTRYAHSVNLGFVSAPGQIFSGPATGQRHFVGGLSLIFTNGGDPLSYFPGNLAGGTGSGGQFT